MLEDQSEIPSFHFEEDYEFNPFSVIQKDLLPNNECFILYNLFTVKECQQLVQRGEDYGFLDLSDAYTRTYRNNQRIVHYNQSLQQIMWQRLQPYLTDTLEIHGRHETLHTNFYTSGIWQKKGLNENFRLCKYFPDNFFKRHVDEGFHPDITRIRTMKTCMLYLNNEFTGGDTIFYFSAEGSAAAEGGVSPVALRPEPGMCLIFNQKILHEGATVTSGFKYFIRTDIFYEKIQSDETPELTEKQLEALKVYEEAVQQENAKNHTLSIKLYSKATKIYENVYELYNDLYN